MQELWKDIENSNGNYQVSSCGNVRSVSRKVFNGKGYFVLPSKILKQRLSKKGYCVIDLKLKGKKKYLQVHRLVAKAFIPQIEGKLQINHIDGIKSNNNTENLEWCNNSENQIHAYAMGLNIHSDKSGRPKRAVIQFDKNGNIIEKFSSIAEAGRKTKSSAGDIRMCCVGGRKAVKGFIWKFVEEKEVM